MFKMYSRERETERRETIQMYQRHPNRNIYKYYIDIAKRFGHGPHLFLCQFEFLRDFESAHKV